MKAYRYNPVTLIFEGEQERQIDPIASRKAGKTIYLIPANCTTVEPLTVKEGYDIIFDGTNWAYQEQEKKDEQQEQKSDETAAADEAASLDSQYKSNKKALQAYYIDFLIAGDEEGMSEIKAELASLAEKYDSDIANLEGASK